MQLGVEHRLCAAGKGHNGGDLGIDPRIHDRCQRAELRRRPQSGRDECQRVGAQIHERAAGRVRAEDEVAGLEVFAVCGQDRCHLAQGAVVGQLPEHIELRQEERPQRLRRKQPGGRGTVADVPGLDGVDAEGLFDEHMLAGHQGEQGAALMEVVRGGHADDVHIGGGQFLVAAIGCGHPKPVRIGLVAGEGTGADSRNDWAGVGLHGFGESLGNPARAHDAPSQGRGVHGIRDARPRQCLDHEQSTFVKPAPPSRESVMSASAAWAARRPPREVASGDTSPQAREWIRACS